MNEKHTNVKLKKRIWRKVGKPSDVKSINSIKKKAAFKRKYLNLAVGCFTLTGVHLCSSQLIDIIGFAASKVPKSTEASIGLKQYQLGPPRASVRAGCSTKLSSLWKTGSRFDQEPSEPSSRAPEWPGRSFSSEKTALHLYTTIPTLKQGGGRSIMRGGFVPAAVTRRLIRVEANLHRANYRSFMKTRPRDPRTSEWIKVFLPTRESQDNVDHLLWPDYCQQGEH